MFYFRECSRAVAQPSSEWHRDHLPAASPLPAVASALIRKDWRLAIEVSHGFVSDAPTERI